MFIFGLFILSSIFSFTAGVVFGYHKGFIAGTRKAVAKILTMVTEEALKEADKKVYRLVQESADAINSRWGKFLGFSDTDIKKAKDEATKDYEKELN